MSDKDTITLPREVVKSAIAALESSLVREPGGTTRRERESITALRTALAAEQPKKTPAWWMDGLATTLMREGVNKHRAREIAAAYWDAYCQIPGNEEEPT